MSKPVSVGEGSPRIVKWEVDAEPCKVFQAPAWNRMFVQVSGMDNQPAVTINGGFLQDKLTVLDVMRSDGVIEIVPVRFIQPVTMGKGMTIIVTGVE